MKSQLQSIMPHYHKRSARAYLFRPGPARPYMGPACCHTVTAHCHSEKLCWARPVFSWAWPVFSLP